MGGAWSSEEEEAEKVKKGKQKLLLKPLRCSVCLMCTHIQRHPINFNVSPLHLNRGTLNKHTSEPNDYLNSQEKEL